MIIYSFATARIHDFPACSNVGPSSVVGYNRWRPLHAHTRTHHIHVTRLNKITELHSSTPLIHQSISLFLWQGLIWWCGGKKKKKEGGGSTCHVPKGKKRWKINGGSGVLKCKSQRGLKMNQNMIGVSVLSILLQCTLKICCSLSHAWRSWCVLFFASQALNIQYGVTW